MLKYEHYHCARGCMIHTIQGKQNMIIFSMILLARQGYRKNILSTKLKDFVRSWNNEQKLVVTAPENSPFVPFLTLVGSSVGEPDK